MTACVNKKSKRVAAVVTASLVGALSIGAPAVALAANNTSIDLQSADSDQAFSKGTVTEYTVGGRTVKGNAKATVKKSELAKNGIVITKVKPDGAANEVEPTLGTFYYKRATVNDSNKVEINGKYYTYAGDTMAGLSVGEYIAAAANTGMSYQGDGNFAPVVEFSVVADSLDDAQVGAFVDGVFVTDLTFGDVANYDDIKVTLDGETACDDVTLEIYDHNTDKPVTGTNKPLAGTYTAVVTGKGNTNYENESVKFDFTIAKFDLSKAGLKIADRKPNDGEPEFSSILLSDGSSFADKFGASSDWLKLEIKSANAYVPGVLGEYTYELSLTKADERNMTGTATLTFNQVAENASVVNWTYDDAAMPAETQVITIDSSLKKDDFKNNALKSLDLSKIAGTFVNSDGKTVELGEGEYVVKLTDKAGNAVDSLGKKGVYKLTVEAVSSKFDYTVDRSSKTWTLNVKKGTVGQADTVFSYRGSVVKGSKSVTFDGADYLSEFKVQVRDDKGNLLTEGTDYTVKALKGTKEVSQIVDAGDYTIVVSSDSYQFGSDLKDTEVLTVKVAPADIKAVSFDRTKAPFKTFWVGKTNPNGQYTGKGESTTGIPYTGSTIENPTVTFNGKDRDGKDKTYVLPSDTYTIEWKLDGKHVDGLKDVSSKYTAQVILNNGVSNYTTSATLTEACRVLKDMSTGFVDVKDEEWFAEALNKAKVNGYLSGRGETGMVAPTENITRADAVVVLYKMAGGSLKSDEYEYDATKYYETGFSDVDGRAYYANAIAWAQDMDIANGSNGKFRPEDKVTREEFAALLSNYAIAKGDYVAASDDALAGMPDASSVSPWFTDAVSWAVENGIMGNGGKINAQSNIQRAEVAAMAVNYQPGFFA